MKTLEATSLRLTKQGELFILDQQMLPAEENWICVEGPEHMIQIIKDLKVRGAPLIGVAASLALGLWAKNNQPSLDEFVKISEQLRQSRPTAVNLMNALDRMNQCAQDSQMNPEAILQLAIDIFDEDVRLCLEMAEAGASLIEEGDNILTHCNTGGLATVGLGTALGVILRAWEQGKNIHVYVDETRPLLQGGRLTTWELARAGVPYTLICDNMAASLMAQNKVQKVFVGADRIARNGDFANKIGTYNLAVLCQHHDIPFYTVAPKTTWDPHCAQGDQIPVEQRNPQEVRGVNGSFGEVTWSPEQAAVYNPAFDITPQELLTGWVIDGRCIRQDQADGDLVPFLG